jgi:hypothetical protein
MCGAIACKSVQPAQSASATTRSPSNKVSKASNGNQETFPLPPNGMMTTSEMLESPIGKELLKSFKKIKSSDTEAFSLPLKMKKLVTTIQSLEQRGLVGYWFAGLAPFASEEGLLYYVKSLPSISTNSAERKSESFAMMRTAQTLNRLQGMMDEGIPFVVHPSSSSAIAACVLDSQVAGAAALLKLIDSEQHAVIFIDLSAGEFVVEHEVQHWRDFQKGAAFVQFRKALRQWIESLPARAQKRIYPELEGAIQQIVIETRGHQRMIIAAREDFDQHQISAVTDKPTTKEDVINVEFFATSGTFNQYYPDKILTIKAELTAILKPEEKTLVKKTLESFTKMVSEFDLLHEEPDMPRLETYFAFK